MSHHKTFLLKLYMGSGRPIKFACELIPLHSCQLPFLLLNMWAVIPPHNIERSWFYSSVCVVFWNTLEDFNGNLKLNTVLSPYITSWLQGPVQEKFQGRFLKQAFILATWNIILEVLLQIIHAFYLGNLLMGKNGSIGIIRSGGQTSSTREISFTIMRLFFFKEGFKQVTYSSCSVQPWGLQSPFS